MHKLAAVKDRPQPGCLSFTASKKCCQHACLLENNVHGKAVQDKIRKVARIFFRNFSPDCVRGFLAEVL